MKVELISRNISESHQISWDNGISCIYKTVDGELKSYDFWHDKSDTKFSFYNSNREYVTNPKNPLYEINKKSVQFSTIKELLDFDDFSSLYHVSTHYKLLDFEHNYVIEKPLHVSIMNAETDGEGFESYESAHDYEKKIHTCKFIEVISCNIRNWNEIYEPISRDDNYFIELSFKFTDVDTANKMYYLTGIEFENTLNTLFDK